MLTNKTTANGFEYIEIENKSATAKIALQGGHLFHYQQQGRKPLLWVSKNSSFETAKAIRGGIPICWPWFGKHSTDSTLPQHGFARISPFELVEIKEPDENTTEVLLQLQSSTRTLALWPYQFRVLLRIIIAKALTVALTTRNCDTESFTISSALHSYFAVSHISNVSVQGLDKREYWDALTDDHKSQEGSVHISEEVDRVYQKVTKPLILHDLDNTVQITATGSSSAVVWNPWVDKSRRMTDMQNDAYQTMLCIETANALEDARELAPGDEHTLQCRYSYLT
jgi:glucose-6-phosphate 1-epimerase